MKKRHPRRILAVLSVAGAIVTSNSAAATDDFSEARLRSGEDATVARHYLEAISELKIAAFGSLDRPPALSEALVWLALAQNGAGRAADLQTTLDRFLDVERRFGAYPKAHLEPDTRAAFQAILLKQVPQPTVQAIPSLAKLIETPDQKFASLPAADRRRALEASARSEPGDAKWPAALAVDAINRGDAKDAARWSDQALKLEPGNADALAARARARVATKNYSGAVRDFVALAPSELARRPELAADRFVALVETGDWSGAEQVLTGISVPAASRADVARAQQKLATEKQRRNAATASAPAPAAQGSASPAPASATASASPPAAASSSPPAPGSPAGASSGKTVASGPDATAARSRETLAESRRLITSGKSAEAVRLLNDALRADPGNRELRLTLLEAGCLSRSYGVAAAQLPLITPFSDTEAAPMFYAAVVLYETGRDNEAKSYLEKAAPRVSGPLVDEYSRKILGRP
jgi:tetratricopeptide (TPR) repeat protein